MIWLAQGPEVSACPPAFYRQEPLSAATASGCASGMARGYHGRSAASIPTETTANLEPSAAPADATAARSDEGVARVVVCGAAARSLLTFRGDLLAELRRRGYEVLACAPDASPDVRRALADLGATYVDIPCERTGLGLRRDLELFWALFTLFRRRRPQLVLLYMIKPVIYGSLAARLAGVPKICSMITGLGYALTGNTLARRALKAASASLLRHSLRGNRVVFFQNPDDRAHFQRLGLLRAGQEAVLINGSGVDLERFAPTPPPPEISFLLIARLIADKGIRDYAAAARLVRARHPEVRFRLVGRFDSNPAALREAEVEGWSREGLIDYLGWLDDVRPAIAASSVYVLPSYYPEGTPRSILEAMAMGRAIVTTDLPGCRETVRTGINGFLVPARDPVALAATLERFIDQPDEIARMGCASRRLAVEKYDVHKVNAVILQAMGVAP